jgi:competence protein ComEC
MGGDFMAPDPSVSQPQFRRLAFFAFSFGVGAFCGSLLPQLWMGLIPLALLLGLGAVFTHLGGVYRQRLFLSVAGCAVGLLWLTLYSLIFVQPITELDGTEASFSATVLSQPVAYSYSYRVTAQVEEVGSVTLYTDDPEGLSPGVTVTGTGTFTEGSAYQASQGIFLTLSASELTVTGETFSPITWPGRVSAQIQAAIARLFSGKVQGLYQALLTGDKSLLPTSLSTALSRCGLNHVVAISGLHLSILAGALFFLLRRPKSRLLALPVLLFFTVMVGSLSAWRALLMEVLILVAPLVRRQEDSLTSLAFALLVILARNPLAVGSVSLQLSFGAMLGIALFTNRIYTKVDLHRLSRSIPAPISNVLRGGWSLLCSTLGASLATLPLVAWYYRQISLIALLSNLLVVWLFTPALVLGLLAVALTLIFPQGAAVWAVLPGLVAQVILFLVHRLGALTFAALPLNNGYRQLWFFFLLFVLVLLGICPQLRKRPVIPLGSLAVTLAVTLLLGRLSVDTTAATLKVLDVGQGQCILLVSQGRTAAIDCGGSGSDSAGDLLADELQALGVSDLDLLILTHYDSDHSGGLSELFARISVDTVACPAILEEEAGQLLLYSLASEQGSALVEVSEVTRYQLGTGQLTLYPPGDESGGNNGSLALLGEFQDFEFLITGDMDETGEQILVSRYDLPQVELLVAGHHGSKYASSELLLEAVQPETAVISVGANNRYGHPTAEALARLREIGADIYRTDQNGSITIQIGE